MKALDAIAIGDLVLVALPVHNPPGREQQGTRPGVVVGVPSGEIRYPTIAIAPLTTATGSWSRNNPKLYPPLEAGVGGLYRPSIVLVPQVRGIDVRRVVRYLGTLTPEEYAPIREGLIQWFGLRSAT